jgi:hypothetical protein
MVAGEETTTIAVAVSFQHTTQTINRTKLTILKILILTSANSYTRTDLNTKGFPSPVSVKRIT